MSLLSPLNREQSPYNLSGILKEFCIDYISLCTLPIFKLFSMREVVASIPPRESPKTNKKPNDGRFMRSA